MCQGSHYRDGWECKRCGYSRFHFLGEFHGEDPLDRTKVCADCGNINTAVGWRVALPDSEAVAR